MDSLKFDWIEIQKTYDDLNISGRKLCEIFNLSKSILYSATLKGIFRPRKRKIIPNENCLECGAKLLISSNNQKYNKFCNHSCSASHSNKQRNTSFCRTLKKAVCVECFAEGEIKCNTDALKYKCDTCKVKIFGATGRGKTSVLKIKNKIPNGKFCGNCNVSLSNWQEIYCSRKCLTAKTDFVKLGKSGGNISKNIQVRRSKNEIHFYELCKQKFSFVKHNETLFNGWDADVILVNEKIAILWNGIWHYKQVRKKHSLLQVQTRDKLKLKQIQIW